MSAPLGPVEIARTFWGDDLPDWVAELARRCAASSQNAVAAQMGRSSAMVSNVLRRKYPGDLAGVQEVVEGVFMRAICGCPALGDIPTHVCRQWRDKSRAFAPTNEQRVRMYRACLKCPRNQKDEDK